MQQREIRHLVVADGKHLLGIVSERDLGGKTGADLRKGRTVGELMTSPLVSATPETTVRQAANLMRGRTIGCLPVVDEGRLVGIVTTTDVLEQLGRGTARPAVQTQRPTLRLPANNKTLGGRPKRAAGARSQRLGGVSSGRRPRKRRPGSAKRALPSKIARRVRRTSGRTAAPETPAHVRSLGFAIDADDLEYIHHKLGTKLGKFAHSVERVSVRLTDVNGPRGGVDKLCRIKVVLVGLPTVVIERRDPVMKAAFDVAVTTTERAVRKALQRRRTSPRRDGAPDDDSRRDEESRARRHRRQRRMANVMNDLENGSDRVLWSRV